MIFIIKIWFFIGFDLFKGEIVYLYDYKIFMGYEDKWIVVIGIGNLGGDVVVEFSCVVK